MKRPLVLAPAACALLLCAMPPVAAAAEPPEFRWDRYFDQDQVTAALAALHAAYPQLTELRSIGTSAEGRDIWQLTIGNPLTGPLDRKPAMYADGAIHGNEIQATEVCLYLAWLLLDRYGEWDRITELVDRAAFYIVPTVNVDSRARFFSDPGSHEIGRTARVPFDDDQDGRLDEDGPEDLDGDGLVLQMRVRDPFGTHRTDPDDPRVVVRIEPGEQAEWTLLGLEGLDNDGDGRVNEDGPGYLDLNRNYGFNWQPAYVQSGAGLYPFSASNTRAIADFLAAHPNVAFAFTFHNYGGMFLRGPGSPDSPPYDPADIAVWDWLGREGERTVPGYRYLVSYQDLYSTYGDFDEFAYQVFGILGYTGELTMANEFAYRGRRDTPVVPAGDPAGDPWSHRPPLAEKQDFNDHLMAGEMFRAWTPYDHPQYGPLEIGGWKPFAVRSTPGFLLPEMLHRNAMFVVWTATQLPRVSVAVVAVEDLGGGLRRVRARASNAGGLPTLSAQALAKRLCPRDAFAIGGPDLEVLSGGLVRDPWLGGVDAAPHRPARLETSLPGQGVREAEWIVRGAGKLAVTYDGLRCGAAAADTTVR
ncbi:MAG TPA: M14 family metallopeptidase [Candidatus Krumholzibacteria bacterium]|nr:M14 family metallopeptidase [Candidatus Krumholzibacteria bacterium]HPD72890.1 M14 family metallopeptidase [Candidatus Krumholzibacteria bacterium]HRY41689.1 M14 family metallopeptidase [Candidatus Krumholzibacteria bacterium]